MSVKSSLKHLSLEEVKKVVDSLGNLVQNTLDSYSMSLVITKSGEATFTRSACKLLTEAGFSSPLAKIVISYVKTYVNFCGEDCKYYFFILKELLSAICKKINGSEESFIRVKFIHEITLFKRMLTCIFNNVKNMSDVHVTPLNSCSFSGDLYSIVKTFMESRFSVNVSKYLGSLICDFIRSIMCEKSSLKFILDYVITHFDVFCSKALGPLFESQILKGFVFYRKSVPFIKISQNVKFIVIWELSMKSLANDVSWEISNNTFINELNNYRKYQNVFHYFKQQNIKVLLTPSVADKNIILMCEKNDILLIDRLDKEEIENIVSCTHVSPLENLCESLESKHIEDLEYFKLITLNKSSFFNLICSNSPKFINMHHILLCAQFDSLWKEYYSECLYCLKMVRCWLSPTLSLCSFQSDSAIAELLNIPMQECTSKLSSLQVNNVNNGNLTAINEKIYQLQSINNNDEMNVDGCCNICSLLKLENCLSYKPTSFELDQDVGVALSSCLWELSFLTSLEQVSKDLCQPCKNVIPALQFTFIKLLCIRIGVSFCTIDGLKKSYTEFYERHAVDSRNLLEPVLCKEMMICSVLDLIVQLLKIDEVISAK